MKFMEWNIHGMGGNNYQSIPVKLLLETVIKIEADVIVLLEFIEFCSGYKDLEYGLNKLGYDIFTTTYKNNTNGVLIAVRTKYKPQKIEEKEEYLEVSIDTGGQHRVSVIGMRVFTQGKYVNFKNRKELLISRLNLLSSDKSFVLMIDSNNGAIQCESNKNFEYVNCERKEYSYQYIWRLVEDEYNWSLVTPDKGGVYSGGKYSVITGKNIPENYHTKEDHIISSFDEKSFFNVDYYWDFVSKRNGYGMRKSTDILSDLTGMPDHAVLIAEIDFDNSDKGNRSDKNSD